MKFTKLFSFLTAVVFSAGFVLPASAAETAFTALRVIQSQRSAALVASLAEIRGERGGHQPDVWIFLFNDPGARGGVREITVQKGAITSERTPLRGFSGVGDLPRLRGDNLKIDSNTAFRLVNAAAAKQGLGFHWLDYTLRPDSETAAPLWVLDLIDYLGVRVGTMMLSAESGKTIRALSVTRSDEIQNATVSTPVAPQQEQMGGFLGEVRDVSKKVNNTMRKGTLNVIGGVEEWLTGERTIGLED